MWKIRELLLWKTIFKCRGQQHLVHSELCDFLILEYFHHPKRERTPHQQWRPLAFSSQPLANTKLLSRNLSPARDRQNFFSHGKHSLQVLRFMLGSCFLSPSFAGPGLHLLPQWGTGTFILRKWIHSGAFVSRISHDMIYILRKSFWSIYWDEAARMHIERHSQNTIADLNDDKLHSGSNKSRVVKSGWIPQLY